MHLEKMLLLQRVKRTKQVKCWFRVITTDFHVFLRLTSKRERERRTDTFFCLRERRRDDLCCDPSSSPSNLPTAILLLQTGIKKDMSLTNGFSGVSNCYVFKSRLQEYAQKEKLPTPVYETLREGPSHEPCFRSTVIVNDVSYNSLPGFCNRKGAEQSAAEIALMELAKLGSSSGSIVHPVHETGLCKNLLQEYTQKMNYAVPAYVCHQFEAAGTWMYTCTVDIGGMQYIGAAARTKKEAEIKAARTALLAIQSNRCGFETPSNGPSGGDSQLTVLPSKKKINESKPAQVKTKKTLEPNKASFKKKQRKRKARQNNCDQVKDNPTGEATGNDAGDRMETYEQNQLQVSLPEVIDNSQYEQNQLHASLPEVIDNSQFGQTVPLNSNQNERGCSNVETLSGLPGMNLATLVTEVSEVGS